MFVENVFNNERGVKNDDEACPGCGCEPGDGVTEDCDDPAGCGFWKEQQEQEV
jgi:hypothetical protein